MASRASDSRICSRTHGVRSQNSVVTSKFARRALAGTRSHITRGAIAASRAAIGRIANRGCGSPRSRFLVGGNSGRLAKMLTGPRTPTRASRPGLPCQRLAHDVDREGHVDRVPEGAPLKTDNTSTESSIAIATRPAWGACPRRSRPQPAPGAIAADAAIYHLSARPRSDARLTIWQSYCSNRSLHLFPRHIAIARRRGLHARRERTRSR